MGIRTAPSARTEPAPSPSAAGVRSPAAGATTMPGLMQTVALAVVCAVAGMALGWLILESRQRDQAHITGACIALEMAAVHVVLDDMTYHTVVRALTSTLNPYRDSFPVTYREMMRQCAEIRSHTALH